MNELFMCSFCMFVNQKIQVVNHENNLQSKASSESMNDNSVGYPKMLFTLGMECKCCDGASSNENCESIWKGSCSKLQCLPWKQYRHV
ncbi:hypothetical protein CTI12_AA147110 [Artemisia annua]|uniref:Uncharacterized protein n=1 Tax=Artemisia annua TaxID=35608 RepID=A0A2U1PIK9_ARTAN|nr:hypothetical protein CTI12_AA147110 [Artemisia annua]